jgi:hypothetical protein
MGKQTPHGSLANRTIRIVSLVDEMRQKFSSVAGRAVVSLELSLSVARSLRLHPTRLSGRAEGEPTSTINPLLAAKCIINCPSWLHPRLPTREKRSKFSHEHPAGLLEDLQRPYTRPFYSI